MDKFSLEKFFNDTVKNPFTYNMNLEKQDSKSVFEELKKIFLTGLFHKTENKLINTNLGTSIDLEKINDKEINKVKEYMLSFGVELNYKKYNLEDKDYHIRKVLYEIENIKDIKIKITSDWYTQHIDKVSIGVDKEHIQELNKILRKYPISNYFLNLYQPETIQDFKIQYIKKNEPDIINIIYFEPAKITEHHYNHQYMDNFDKHIR